MIQIITKSTILCPACMTYHINGFLRLTWYRKYSSLTSLAVGAAALTDLFPTECQNSRSEPDNFTIPLNSSEAPLDECR